MAGTVRASKYAGGLIIRYAAVALSLLTLLVPVHAQDAPPVPQAAAEAGWDASTSPAQAKAPRVKDLKPKLQPPSVTKPQLRSGTADEAVTAGTKVVKHSGLKGVPHVEQSELLPVPERPAADGFSVITTGAVGQGDAKGAKKINAGVVAQQDPEAAKPEAAAAAPAGTGASDATKSDGVQVAPEASKPDAAVPAAAPAVPVPVTVGLYINDIQDIDFRTDSYLVDLYMWFRWKGKELDPIKSVEFMNVYDPQNSQKSVLLDAPKEMPDGSLYNIVRYHGRFSKKFLLEKYPFDVQSLDFVLEDSVAPSSQQVFVADTRGIGMNPTMSLPGFKFATPKLDVTAYTYPTDFGDLSVPSAETYSRAVVSVPINRPVFTLAIKTFGPILLIVICSMMVFFINPHFVEGRVGLAITALLTLVAIQFTAGSSQPDADYFTMLDKLYMLSYSFIIASLLRVVMTSWQTVEGSLQDLSVSKRDHRWGYMLLLLYAIIAAAIASWVLSK